MKRTIAFIFILLANISLLAHAAIPHHHHTSVGICFHSTHCTDCKDTDKHSHDANHQHDDGDAKEACMLNEMYARFDNKPIVDSNLGDETQYPVILLFSAIPSTPITDPGGLPFRQKPYLLSFYTDPVPLPFGLRAPPVC